MHLLSAENDLVSEFITTHSMEKKLLSVSSTKYLLSSKYLYPGADLGGGGGSVEPPKLEPLTSKKL